MQKKTVVLIPALALGLLAQAAQATNGYFTHGYGVKAQGMGGVGIALPQDALAAASNPAGMALVGDRVDFGMTWFRPQRASELSGTAGGSGMFDGVYRANDSEHFFIPEFGYNRRINQGLTLGVSVYGNGGMNTDYKNGIPLFGSTTRAGVDMAQLFIAPTATWKINDNHALGVAVNLAYQRFEAKGLQGFDNPGFSTSPGNVTNNGHDSSYGAGLHFGWIGKVSDRVTLGAHYQTRTWMTAFDDYKGLFAEQGDFDVPSRYGVGIALNASPEFTIAFDVERINYSDTDSVGRRSLPNLPNRLGSDNGPGFGWQDITVYKLGASYAVNDKLTVRAGYNHGGQPIRGSDTFFNILAPGVIEDHLTLGATWVLPNGGELSIAYMHAFEEKVNGSNSIPAVPLGGGEADLKMYQDSLGIAYGWKF